MRRSPFESSHRTAWLEPRPPQTAREFLRRFPSPGPTCPSSAPVSNVHLVDELRWLRVQGYQEEETAAPRTTM